MYRRSGKVVVVLGRWRKKRGGNPAKQQGDPHELDREGDPRGGVQSDEYRHADPRDLVTDEGVAMTGPGGTPQEDTTPDERREEQR